ncbi:NAD(P)/FAD-dependent oxidoreductase [Neorhodopirellula lusitana]|uniref:NAD(P)/FAD-dependent oxidoreductase n=1 Tax=Neorhodopirellula lusitana TaxID=445327 RepID=UPI00384E7E67
MKDFYDCVVIGAGPAGGTTAAIVAEAGHKTLLIEREAVPRFHVGESLMPETYWPLQRLGLVDRMKSSGWQRKKSVQFVSHTGKESAPFFFEEHDDRECATTWQVERSEFDQMIFERAEELGADCHDRTRLMDVRFENADETAGDGGDSQPRATGVVVRDASGTERTIDCKVVVDATGQQSFIAGKLGLKEVNEDLKKAAIWTYYKDAVRGEGDNDGATIILNTEGKESWFWFIPQSRGITSIGCVGDHEYLLKGRGTPEEIFNEELARCPGLQPRLENATRVSKFLAAKEFSYMTSAHSGPGWVLVGDAFGFIDPVYSSGVYFALEMGVQAGDAISAGLTSGDLSEKSLGHWATDFKRGASHLRQLVHAFYDNDFSIGRFMKEYPQYRGNLTDLLIGRIFHEDAGKMFPDMQRSIEKTRQEKLKQSEMTA